MPTITIGILTHNAGEYIGRTIPAILSWMRPEYEVLVVDNGSTDGTIERLRQYPQIRVECNGENAGYGRGRNALVDKSRAPYVLLLDDDVLVPSEQVVLDCLAFCESRPEVAFVSVPLTEPGRDRTPHYGLFFAQPKRDRSLRELESLACFQAGGFTGGLTFCRRSVFQRLGGYDTIYPCQDYDLSARAHLQGWRIYTVTTVHAIHLGVDRKVDVDHWVAWNDYQLCGFLRTILKNYTMAGVVCWTPLASAWILWKTVRKYRETGEPKVLLTYVRSLRYLFRDLRNTLEERSRVQSTRIVRRDTFRTISFPRNGHPRSPGELPGINR
jgi:GT2 family glycosyltransferase